MKESEFQGCIGLVRHLDTPEEDIGTSETQAYLILRF